MGLGGFAAKSGMEARSMNIKVALRIGAEVCVLAFFVSAILFAGWTIGLASGGVVTSVGIVILSVVFAYNVFPYRAHYERWKKELHGNNKN